MEQHANTAMIADGAPIAANTNIIAFPRKIDSEPVTMVDAKENIEAVRYHICEEVADEQFDAMIAIGRNYGLFVREDRTNLKDLYFLRDFILSMNLRYYGIEHQLQRIPDEAITFTSAEETETGDEDPKE